MRKFYKASIFWWTESKRKEGLRKTREEAAEWIEDWLSVYPADDHTETRIDEVYLDVGENL